MNEKLFPNLDPTATCVAAEALCFTSETVLVLSLHVTPATDWENRIVTETEGLVVGVLMGEG